MSTWAISAMLLVFGMCVLVNGQWPANENEIKICKESDSREFVSASKTRRMDCKVNCEYNGGRGTQNSPMEQPCCEAGGLPTGTCGNDGKCRTGNFGK